MKPLPKRPRKPNAQESGFRQSLTVSREMKVRIYREAEKNGLSMKAQVADFLGVALTFIKENGSKKRDFFVAEGSLNLNKNKNRF